MITDPKNMFAKKKSKRLNAEAKLQSQRQWLDANLNIFSFKDQMIYFLGLASEEYFAKYYLYNEIVKSINWEAYTSNPAITITDPHNMFFTKIASFAWFQITAFLNDCDIELT